VFRRTNWVKTLRMVKPFTAPGPDGLRPEHVRAMLTAGPGAPRILADAVARYAAALENGALDAEATQIALAARIAFIPKRDGTQRPLGVVGLWRRIIARAAAVGTLVGILPWLIARGQFGAGAPAGVEALAALVQAALDRGEYAVLVDRAVAYSNMAPAAVVAAVQALLPDLAPLARTLMQAALVVGAPGGPRLFAGLFMGCALSPLFFALTEEALLERVRALLGERRIRTAGFLDDKVLLGATIAACRDAFLLMEGAAADGGQRTNRHKTLVLALASQQAPNPQLEVAEQWPGVRTATDGARVVGDGGTTRGHEPAVRAAGVLPAARGPGLASRATCDARDARPSVGGGGPRARRGGAR